MTQRIKLRYLLHPREVSNVTDLQVLSVYRDHGVIPKNSRNDNFNKTPQDLSRYQEVREGDLVVNKMKAWQGSLAVSRHHGIVSPDYLVCTASPEVDRRYLHYLLRSSQMVADYGRRSQGIRPSQWRLYWEDLADIAIDLPSRDAQRRIADFLDVETMRIDNLRQARWRQKSLLVEHTKQHIRELATGVVDYEILYNTGNPWIPKLPEGWQLLPLKRRWTVIDCKHRTPTYLDHGIPVISPGDVNPGRLDLSRAHRFVSESDYRDLADDLRRPRKGDIVYSRNASVGIAAYVDTEEKFTMGQDVCRITSTNQDQLFLSFVLNTVVQGEIESLQIGSTFTRINIATLLGLGVPCPSPDEQHNIALQMDKVSRRGDDLQRKLDRQLEVLVERRQALVTAAVTGQFDVFAASGRGVTE